MEKYGYKANSDKNEREVLLWDIKKLEFFIQKLMKMERKMYINPSLLLFVNKYYHPVAEDWDRDIKRKIVEFSKNTHMDLLKWKIDEVYGNEPFVEEVHQSFMKMKIKKMDDHLEKLDLIKKYQYQRNFSIAKCVSRYSYSKLKDLLEKRDQILKNEINIHVLSDEEKSDIGSNPVLEEVVKGDNLREKPTQQNEEHMGGSEKDLHGVEDLLLTVCRKHQLHRNVKLTREIIEILMSFGFKYHEIALADPQIFRVRNTEKLVEVLSEKFETTNLKTEEIKSEVEKRVKRRVGTKQIEEILHIDGEHVSEQRKFLKGKFNNDVENILKNLEFLMKAEFDPYEIMACFLIGNFHHDSLCYAFDRTSSDFESGGLDVKNCPAGRISLLYQVYLNLSRKQGVKFINLDDIAQDYSARCDPHSNPDEDRESEEVDFDTTAVDSL